MTPNKAHATFIPDTVKTNKQVIFFTYFLDTTPIAFDDTMVSGVFYDFSIPHQWFIYIRLLYSHLTGYLSCLFLYRSLQQIFACRSIKWFADYACTSSAEVQSFVFSGWSQLTLFARAPLLNYYPCAVPKPSMSKFSIVDNSFITFIQGTRQIVKVS